MMIIEDRLIKCLLSVPWILAEADDIDVWWSQWKDLFFVVVQDSVTQVCWWRKKKKKLVV